MKDNKYFPQKIFRYRRCDTDYFLDELDNAINFQRVFLCSARNVNDPFEFAPAYEESPTEEVLRLLKKRFGNKPIVSREILNPSMEGDFLVNSIENTLVISKLAMNLPNY